MKYINCSVSKKIFIFFLFFIGSASSQTYLLPGKISKISTGWNVDAVSIFMSTGISNPANCSMNDLVIMDITTPGYKTHYLAAALAFSMNSDITIVISNTQCLYGRPKIIGLSVSN